MDLTSMRARVRLLTNLESNFISDSQLNNLINETCEDFQNYTEILKSEAQANVTSGTSTYLFSLFSSLFHKLIRLEHDDVEIFEIDRDALDRVDTDWRDNTGTPTNFFIDSGNKRFHAFPQPSASITNGWRLIYVQRPNSLSNDGDISNITAEYHMYLCYNVAGEALYRDQEFAWGDRYLKMYEVKKEQARREQQYPSYSDRYVRRAHVIRGRRPALNLGDNFPNV